MKCGGDLPRNEKTGGSHKEARFLLLLWEVKFLEFLGAEAGQYKGEQ